MKRTCLVAALLLSACAQKPTRVTETTNRPFDLVIAKARSKIEITDQTVVLDARGAFDHGLAHVRKSINFTWDQLAQSRADGEPLRDQRRAGDRLALIGITPATPVIVVGDAPKGDGGDGRLAWALVRLGVRDVQIVNNDALRAYWSPEVSPPPTNAAPWTPAVATELELDAPKLKTIATSIEDLKDKRTWLIDVRTPAEYLKKFSIAGTVNVPWTDFYTRDGRPNPRVVRQLDGIGIQPKDRVIMLSPRGVRAAAAAFALMALEFPTVQVMRL